jgi:hypothetical protein
MARALVALVALPQAFPGFFESVDSLAAWDRAAGACLAPPLDAGAALAGHSCSEKCGLGGVPAPKELRECHGKKERPCYCSGQAQLGWYCLPERDLMHACDKLEECVGVQISMDQPRGVLLGPLCLEEHYWTNSSASYAHMKRVRESRERVLTGAGLSPDEECSLGLAYEVKGVGAGDGLYQAADMFESDVAKQEFRLLDRYQNYRHRIRLDTSSCGWVVEGLDDVRALDAQPVQTQGMQSIGCEDDVEAANVVFGLTGDAVDQHVCSVAAAWSGAADGYCAHPVFRRVCAKTCQVPPGECLQDDVDASRHFHDRGCAGICDAVPKLVAERLCPRTCEGVQGNAALLDRVTSEVREQISRVGARRGKRQKSRRLTDAWIPLFTTFEPLESGACSAVPPASASSTLYSQKGWQTSVGTAGTALRENLRFAVAPFRYCSRGNLAAEFPDIPELGARKDTMLNACIYKCASGKYPYDPIGGEFEPGKSNPHRIAEPDLLDGPLLPMQPSFLRVGRGQHLPSCAGYMQEFPDDSTALCLHRDECEELCGKIASCVSIDMHRTLPRCYLNTADRPCDLRASREYDLIVKELTPGASSNFAGAFTPPVTGEYNISGSGGVLNASAVAPGLLTNRILDSAVDAFVTVPMTAGFPVVLESDSALGSFSVTLPDGNVHAVPDFFSLDRVSNVAPEFVRYSGYRCVRLFSTLEVASLAGKCTTVGEFEYYHHYYFNPEASSATFARRAMAVDDPSLPHDFPDLSYYSNESSYFHSTYAYYYYATKAGLFDAERANTSQVLCMTQRACEEACSEIDACMGFDWSPVGTGGICVLHDSSCFEGQPNAPVPATPGAENPGWTQHVSFVESAWQPGEIAGEYEVIGEAVESEAHCDIFAPRGRFCALGYLAAARECRGYLTCTGLVGFTPALDGRGTPAEWSRKHLEKCDAAPHCAALNRAPCETLQAGALCGECLPATTGAPGPGNTACSAPCLSCAYGIFPEDYRNTTEIELLTWHWVTSVEVTVPPGWTWNTSNASLMPLTRPDIHVLYLNGSAVFTNESYPALWTKYGERFPLSAEQAALEGVMEERVLVFPIGVVTDYFLLTGIHNALSVRVYGTAAPTTAIAPQDDVDTESKMLETEVYVRTEYLWYPPPLPPVLPVVNVTNATIAPLIPTNVTNATNLTNGSNLTTTILTTAPPPGTIPTTTTELFNLTNLTNLSEGWRENYTLANESYLFLFSNLQPPDKKRRQRKVASHMNELIHVRFSLVQIFK